MSARDDASVWGMSPQRIYDELTGGPGSRSLVDAQRITREESAIEGERAKIVRELGSGLEAGWQGGAADGALGATKPLVRASYQGSDLLHQGQDLLSRQGESFETAKNSVEPVGDAPEMDVMDMVDKDALLEVAEYQGKAEKNVQVFGVYDGASMYNEENAPVEFAAPNHSGGDVSVGPSGGMIDSDDYRQDGSGGPGGSGGGPGSGGPGGGGSGGPYGSGAPGGLVPSGGTSTAGYDPGLRPPTSYPPPNAPNQYAPAGPPVGAGPVGFGPVGGGPGGGGSGGGSGGGGGRGPGGGAPVRGPVGGPGAGALAAEEAAARRGGVAAAGAGGRGAAGGPMGAPMGGRGKGDEDTEHERKYMIGPDPDATFDTDVLTAPPVIGEDDEDY